MNGDDRCHGHGIGREKERRTRSGFAIEDDTLRRFDADLLVEFRMCQRQLHGFLEMPHEPEADCGLWNAECRDRQTDRERDVVGSENSFCLTVNPKSNICPHIIPNEDGILRTEKKNYRDTLVFH